MVNSETPRHFVNFIGSDWAQHINSAVSASTGKAPFELIYGYLPRTFPPIVYDEDNPASMNFVENRMLAQRSAQDAIIAAKTEQSHYVNVHRKDDPDINVGDLVAVSNESQPSHLPKETSDKMGRALQGYEGGSYNVQLRLVAHIVSA